MTVNPRFLKRGGGYPPLPQGPVTGEPYQTLVDRAVAHGFTAAQAPFAVAAFRVMKAQHRRDLSVAAVRRRVEVSYPWLFVDPDQLALFAEGEF